MAFGKPKAGGHHSANQVRRGFKVQSGRLSRKNACVTCGGRNYRKVCADCYSPEAKLIEAIREKDNLRDVRIATLVEAARLVCERCYRGVPYYVPRWGEIRHPIDSDDRIERYLCARTCGAEPIILKLVEMWL